MLLNCDAMVSHAAYANTHTHNRTIAALEYNGYLQSYCELHPFMGSCSSDYQTIFNNKLIECVRSNGENLLAEQLKKKIALKIVKADLGKILIITKIIINTLDEETLIKKI